MHGPQGLDSANLPTDAVEVGRIADAWGVKGWFKVHAYSARPDALFSSKRWYLEPPQEPFRNGFDAFDGTVVLKLSEAKLHSDSVVAHAHGFDDRDAAQALKGARIFVSRASFPSTAIDEYYWVDLIGLEVLNRQGLLLGVVDDLLATGAQTVLVVGFGGPDQRGERLIPFVAHFVDAVELSQRRIRVDWQPDY